MTTNQQKVTISPSNVTLLRRLMKARKTHKQSEAINWLLIQYEVAHGDQLPQLEEGDGY